MRTRAPEEMFDGEPAIARLSAFGSLEGTELVGLAQLAGEKRLLDRNEVLWEEGKRLPALYVLLDGWMISSDAAHGRAVTIKVHLPGDVLGLPSLAYATAAETAIALTPARLRPLALHSFGQLFDAHPRIAAIMFLVSQQERMVLTDRLVAAHTAGVRQRLAQFLYQLLDRVRRSFPDTGDSFFLPLGRDHVADLIGVNAAQLAKAVKELRAANVVGWTGRLLTIIDLDALRAEAGLPTRELVRGAHWLPVIDSEE